MRGLALDHWSLQREGASYTRRTRSYELCLSLLVPWKSPFDCRNDAQEQGLRPGFAERQAHQAGSQRHEAHQKYPVANRVAVDALGLHKRTEVLAKRLLLTELRRALVARRDRLRLILARGARAQLQTARALAHRVNRVRRRRRRTTRSHRRRRKHDRHGHQNPQRDTSRTQDPHSACSVPFFRAALVGL